MNQAVARLLVPDSLAARLLPEQLKMSVQARLALARQAMAHRQLPDAIRYCRRALGLSPTDLAVLSEYAHLLDCAGRHDEAIEACQTALALDPGQVDMLLRLGSLMHRSGRTWEAVALMAARLKSDPDNVAVIHAVAAMLINENRLDEALNLIDRGLAVEPANRKLLWQMLDVAGRLGRFNRIRRCLTRLVEADPQSGKAHRMLAEITDYKPGHAHLSTMEIAYAARFEDKPARAQLAYGLFRAFDQLGEHERAFAFLAEANELSAEINPPATSMPVADLAALRTAFPRGLFAGPAFPASKASAQPVFIIGLPFSGRQALARLLDPHAGHKHHMMQGLAPGLLRSLMPTSTQPDPLAGPAAAERIRAVGRAYGERLSQEPAPLLSGVEVLADGHLLLGLIRLALPGARFIHCQRSALPHSFALYAGHPETSGGGWTADLATIGQVHANYREAMAHWKSVAGDAILDIDHDDLVSGDAATQARIRSFLGLPDDAFQHATWPLWCWPPTAGFRLAPYMRFLEPLLDAIKGKHVHKIDATSHLVSGKPVQYG